MVKNLTEVSFQYDNDVDNTNYVGLYQSDFDNGTVRITKPGVYRLMENITFNPNAPATLNDYLPEISFKPTPQQSSLYDTQGGPYSLGFFHAAITIETTDSAGVILDMNGKIIKQSDGHYFNQRFYAHIELGSSPFIRGQGPASFNNENELNQTSYRSAGNVWITNGNFGLSSHHAIHGNTMYNVILSNLDITDFEVAGISINGGKNVMIEDVSIHDSKQDLPMNALLSQSLFAIDILYKGQQSDHIIIVYRTLHNKNLMDKLGNLFLIT